MPKRSREDRNAGLSEFGKAYDEGCRSGGSSIHVGRRRVQGNDVPAWRPKFGQCAASQACVDVRHAHCAVKAASFTQDDSRMVYSEKEGGAKASRLPNLHCLSGPPSRQTVGFFHSHARFDSTAPRFPDTHGLDFSPLSGDAKNQYVCNVLRSGRGTFRCSLRRLGEGRREP